MQQRCIPGMLSWAVSLIRISKFKASDVFPDPGSNIRHPLSVLPSLHRVLRDQFPGFISTMRVLRLPAAHLAALRFLRLAIPRLHSLRSLPDGRVRRQGLELIIRYLHPDVAEEATGAPKFLGNLISVCTCSKPTPAGLLAPDHNGAATWPLVIRRQRLPRLGLSTLNSMAFGLAVYASQRRLPDDHAKLASSCWSGSTGRGSHPQGSDERFQSCTLHLIPPSQAFLAQLMQPLSRRNVRK